MTSSLRKLFVLLLLLVFSSQPLLAQVRTAATMPPPCPLSAAMQGKHQDMAQHTRCIKHADKACADCELCGHSTGVIFDSVLKTALSGSIGPDEQVSTAFISIALPVDSPPPRNI